MIIATIALIAGIAFAFFTPELIDTFWISFLPLLVYLAVCLAPYRFLLILLAGFLWASLGIYQVLNLRLDPEFDHSILKVRGIIEGLPETRHQSVSFIFKPESIEAYPGPLPKKIRLSWYRNKLLPKAGERWQFEAKLKRPGGFQNPGGFDYERWLLVNKIGATGYVKASLYNQLINTASRLQVAYWRSRIAQVIDRYCLDCSHRGLIKALTVGFRGEISGSDRVTLQTTGTAHLLAISGLHIGMVASLFFVLGRLVWRFWFYRFSLNRLELPALCGLSAAIVYAAMAGFSLPTVRALVMLMVISLTLAAGIRINLLHNIAIALVVILFFDPMAIGSLSLWLSFGALLTIAFGFYILSSQLSSWQQTIAIQLLFSVLFIPLTLMLFGQVHAASFVANIVAVPLVGLLILPLILIGGVLALAQVSIAVWLFRFCDLMFGLLLTYLSWLLGSGFSAIHWAGVPLSLIALSAAAMLVLLSPVRAALRKPAWAALLILVLWQRPELNQGEYRMTVLDVGMGTSIVIQTRQHSLIYDFGPGNKRGFSTGEWVLMPFLRHQNISSADMMIISHVDQDHSGGFISFKDNYQAALLMSGTPGQIRRRFALKSGVKSCHLHPRWSWDGVDFEFLAPDKASLPASSNNRSCVLKVSGYHHSLLTGDIEFEQESSLIAKQVEKLPSPVLVVPHHGSLTSSTIAFVKAVSPEASIFTVGKNNRWGFPKAEILKRYQNIDSRILRTDRDGAITVYSQENQLKITAYRSLYPKLWF